MAVGVVTLESIRTELRQRIDRVNSNFFTNSELNGYITGSYKELYDILIQKFGDDYYVSEPYEFTTDGSSFYDVPEDFYKGLGVDASYNGGSGNGWVTLKQFMFQERNSFTLPNYQAFYGITNLRYRFYNNAIWFTPIPISGQLCRLFYIPRPSDLAEGVAATLEIQDLTYTAVDVYEDGNDITIAYTAGATAGAEIVTVTGTAISVQIETAVSTATQVASAITASSDASVLVTVEITGTASDAQTIFSATNLSGGVVQVDVDGVSGWEEYILLDAAIKCMVKEESDPSSFAAQKQALLQRVESAAENRNAGQPQTVSDVNQSFWPYGPWGPGNQ